MSSSPVQMPSPCSTELDRDSSVPPEQKPTTSAVRMLKIHSLLNPSACESSKPQYASVSPPPTPAYTQASSAASTPQPQTPSAPSPAKRQKLVKDAAIFIRGTAKEPINYPPFECMEHAVCLTSQQQDELARQHDHFQIFPSGRGDDGFIADYQRHIPYSSEKKAFYGKTNRDAFEGIIQHHVACLEIVLTMLVVFQYTFRMPDDPTKVHLVMWDYQIGLVRITPFFKALKFSKVRLLCAPFPVPTDTSQTTPAKALTATHGLKELSHSITGGALAAQGYWMPYSCARAVCLTFCYDIRFALTPIFGQSFIKECLRPENPSFGRFKISSEVVRRAQLEAQGLRSGESSRSATPANDAGAFQDIPRSVPHAAAPLKELRPRKEQPTFKLGSPFESDSEASERDYTHFKTPFESPELSPKTTRFHASPGWTSINRRQDMLTPPSPPNNTPVGSLSHSLLTEPRNVPSTFWRALEPTAAIPKVVKSPAGAHGKPRSHKRHIDTGTETDVDADYSGDSSESDDVDIVISPAAKKRQRREDTPVQTTPGSSTPAGLKPGHSTKYTATDARAAQWLLNLSMRDSQLALGPEDS